MAKVRVWFNTSASTFVELEVEDYDPDNLDQEDELIEKAYEEVGPMLCHVCSSKIDIAGDWEVADSDPVEVVEE